MITRYQLGAQLFELACDSKASLGGVWHTLPDCVASRGTPALHYRAYACESVQGETCMLMRNDWLLDPDIAPESLEEHIIRDVLAQDNLHPGPFVLCRGGVASNGDGALIGIDCRSSNARHPSFVLIDGTSGQVHVIPWGDAPQAVTETADLCLLVDSLPSLSKAEEVSKARLLAHWLASPALGPARGRYTNTLEMMVTKAPHCFLVQVEFGEGVLQAVDAVAREQASQ